MSTEQPAIFEIKHRFTGNVLASGSSVKDAAEQAVMRGAYLGGADLRGADLRGVYLRGANLRGANLRGVDLGDADLRDADLGGADLRDADLGGADLRDADLRDADLRDADLGGAYLRGADLRGADLGDADLRDAYLRDADLGGALGLSGPIPADPETPYVRNANPDYAARAAVSRTRHPEVPVVVNLDRRILDAVEGGGKLDMSDWHKCSTTHCRAGWAITLAGEAGAALEREVGPRLAGRLIYLVSTGRVPHFFAATNERAMEDIRACAAESAAPVERTHHAGEDAGAGRVDWACPTIYVVIAGGADAPCG